MTNQAQNLKNQIQSQNQNTDVKSQEDKPTIAKLLKKMEPEIKRALPKHITPERMTRLALTAIRTTPSLAQAEPMSFLASVMQSAQLGLEPNTSLGEAYIIPYNNYKKKTKEAQFQIGYKGLLSLAHRTGQYKAIYAHEVYKNDEFHFEYGLHKDLKHVPADVPEGEPIYYYAVYHLQNGGFDFVVWSREKVIKHAENYSKALKGSTSPWKTDFDSMAKKTVLKDVLKYAPKSIEFAKQLTTDETIKKEIDADMTDVIDVTDYEITEHEEENEEKESELEERNEGESQEE